jgi:hypothetical protein
MKNLSRRTVRSPLNAVEVMGEIKSKQIAGISTMVDHGAIQMNLQNFLYEAH